MLVEFDKPPIVLFPALTVEFATLLFEVELDDELALVLFVWVVVVVLAEVVLVVELVVEELLPLVALAVVVFDTVELSLLVVLTSDDVVF